VLRFPARLDASSAEDNPVRCREACVDALDLDACGFRRALPAATGRPGSAPGALLTRYLDGDLSRLRASRRLAQETPRQVDWRWLLKKRRPADTTSAHFRQTNLEPRRQVCRPCTLLGQKLDRCGAALMAIDGSQFSAVNSTERHFTQDQRKNLIVPSDERLAAYLKELACRDDQEERGTGGGAHAEALEATIAARQQRKRL
jgi:transposase